MPQLNARNVGIGLAGGLVGLLAMRYTMKATQPLVKPADPLTPRDRRSMSLIGDHHQDGEPATEALARNAYVALRRREPTTRQKATLGQAIHFGFGLLMGTLYAVLRAPRLQRPDPLGGALFGAGLWAVGDELAIPLLGLADKPTQYSGTAHLQALLGHIAFGAATGAVVGGIAGSSAADRERLWEKIREGADGTLDRGRKLAKWTAARLPARTA